jgi:F1F0 ATPase subunit 2
MNDYLGRAMAAMAGLAMGGFFFGGLWWTVKRGLVSRAPALWFTGSMLLRTSLVLAGFYFIGFHHWVRLVLCLAGFVLARIVMMGLTWGSRPGPAPNQPEVHHAP